MTSAEGASAEEKMDDDVFIEEGVNVDPPAADEDFAPPDLGVRKRLSLASMQYDVGDKGFLTKSERQVRSYDADGDGNIGVLEAKKMMHDLNETLRGKQFFQKLAGWAVVGGIIMLLGNFGLIWTGLILSRQLSANNGQLVDAKTGAPIAVKGQGHRTEVEVNPDYLAQVFDLRRRHLSGEIDLVEDEAARDEALRRLSTTAITTIPGCDEHGSAKDCIGAAWQNYVQAGLESFTYEHGGATYTGTVADGASQTVSGDCHEYLNVRSTTAAQTYKVKCCGTADCEVFPHQQSTGRRHLQLDFDNCFPLCCGDTIYYCAHEDSYVTPGGEISKDDAMWAMQNYLLAAPPPSPPPPPPPPPPFCLDSNVAGCIPHCVVEEVEGCDDREICFSAESTVIEETKGKMPYKDLKRGDAILSTGGVYRPVVKMIHFNDIVAATFLQIHTESTEDEPLEITEDHLMFLNKIKLPVRAGDVKVGDEVVTVDGPKVVTRISSVERAGVYSALTTDSAHFVDGVLASSMVSNRILHDGVIFKFGLIRIHLHTLMKLLAPTMDFFCTHVNSFGCTATVSDGRGGEINFLDAKCIEDPQLLAPIAAAGVIFALGYNAGFYLFSTLASAALVVGAMTLIQKKSNVKVL